ncbi:MAG TPA: BamA/TamA family outer membrane protein [Kofleriaceae bacterium]|nr:BamA/TamA family outer membrane protein [Kofleriaceae bacterium]
MHRRLVAIGSLLVASMWTARADAQEQAVEKTGEPPTSGWVALPGLTYTPERGLAVAGSVLYYYRNGGADERPSRIQTQASISREKRGEVNVDPDVWLLHERLNVGGTAGVSYFDYGYFGIGNDTRTDAREDYSALRIAARGETVVSLGADLFAGGLYDYRYEDIRDVDDGGELEMETVPGADGGVLSGVGVILRYDSRDNSFQPRAGGLVSVSPRLYDEHLGSDSDFSRLLLDGSWFFGLGGAHVIAVDGRVDLRRGDPPFDHLSQAGGRRLLRGMLEGRFRDNHYVAAQTEYRFPVWWRFGGVLFGGLGRVANAIDEFALTGLKYSVGAGLRFAVKPSERINLRFDAGVSESDLNIYFAIGGLLTRHPVLCPCHIVSTASRLSPLDPRACGAGCVARNVMSVGRMKRLTWIAWMVTGVGCGGPVLQNAPAPNPTHVAAAAAGAAAAMTLADPDGAARKPEKDDAQAGSDAEAIDTRPSDVLGALDRAEAAKSDADGAAHN